MATWVLVIFMNGTWVMPETGERGHPFLIAEACMQHMFKYSKAERPTCYNSRNPEQRITLP